MVFVMRLKTSCIHLRIWIITHCSSCEKLFLILRKIKKHLQLLHCLYQCRIVNFVNIVFILFLIYRRIWELFMKVFFNHCYLLSAFEVDFSKWQFENRVISFHVISVHDLASFIECVWKQSIPLLTNWYSQL